MRYITIKYFFTSKLGVPTNTEALDAYINFCINHHIEDGICEKHHILPRSTHPEFVDLRDHPFNYSRLLFEDHVRAHQLLSLAYPNITSIQSAYRIMIQCLQHRITLQEPTLTKSKKTRSSNIIKKTVDNRKRSIQLKSERLEIAIIEKYNNVFDLTLKQKNWKTKSTAFLQSVIEEYKRVYYDVDIDLDFELTNELLDRRNLLTVIKRTNYKPLIETVINRLDMEITPELLEKINKATARVTKWKGKSYNQSIRIICDIITKQLNKKPPMTSTERARKSRACKKEKNKKQ